MFTKRKEKGFTLIELLLVVVIIGILLAVIVPRAWRANVDAKYSIVRQNATELASVAVQWAENQLHAQDADSTAQLVNYLVYITGGYIGTDPSGTAYNGSNTWIANTSVGQSRGWKVVTGAVPGRRIGGGDSDVGPSGPAMEMMPVDRRARNPFNGMDVFASPSNDPIAASSAIPGAIASGYAVDGELGPNWFYFGLRFQGTDSTEYDLQSERTGIFHADMDGAYTASNSIQLNSLRAGIFMARAYYSGP